MRAVCLGLLGLLSVLSASCGDSQSAPSGISEPLRVANGQFIAGSFPSAHDSGPAVTQLNIKNSTFVAGTTGKVISGLAGAGSQSVALGLQGMGSGFWILPVGPPDQVTIGTFQWSATCDFSPSLPAGPLPMLIAASDSAGRFGPITDQHLNIESLLPPGHVVASLTWGVDADLDLHLVSPSGKELSPKKPNTGALDQDGMALPGSGLLQHDSLAGCVPDGMRTENVVWSDNPQVGTYLVRVDMFSACGKPAASFAFSLYVDGQQVLRKTGRLLDIDADGGGPGSGLFVTEFTCEGNGTCS